MATNDYAGSRLQHLKGSDFEVADGQPDIRGWNIKDVDGKTIGEVDDLIFDERTLKVRYMVVDLDHNDFKLDKDRNVLVPIGYGEIPEKDDVIVIPTITANQLSALPVYSNARLITPEDEYQVRNVFTGTAMGATAGVINDDFYNHEYYDQENLHRRRNPLFGNRNTTDTAIPDSTADTANTSNLENTYSPVNAINTTATDRDNYAANTTGNDRSAAARNRKQESTTIPVIEEMVQIGKQQVSTGGAYIKARIVEQPIEETINLKEEHLNIERNPVDRPANSTDFDTFKEGVIELEERAEVPVVNKQARVVEEIKVNKEVSEHTETVKDTVRKTEVDIENLGNKTGNYRKND